ncbi:hypothetical protein QTP70_023275, partial [Hemibagrus guttatus]
ACASLTWGAHGTRMHYGKKPVEAVSCFGKLFCCETSGPAIHVDVTLTCTTYLSTVADHVHPFMETVFPDACGLFQQDNAPCHKAKMVQEWFDEHNNKFEVFIGHMIHLTGPSQQQHLQTQKSFQSSKLSDSVCWVQGYGHVPRSTVLCPHLE